MGTINRLVLDRVAKAPDLPAGIRKVDGRWVPISWTDGLRQVRALAHALSSHGVNKGDRVAILSQTRVEWVLADFAILAVGALTVGIYPTNTPDQVAYILNDSGASVLFVEDRAQLERLRHVLPGCPSVTLVVVMADGQTAEGAVPFGKLLETGAALDAKYPHSFLVWANSVKPSDPCTLVYTSGTTGQPKGAICTHGNFHHVASVVPKELGLTGDDVTLVFLPMAHSLQRYVLYAGLVTGGEAWFAESMEKVPENLVEVRPTMLPAVPRLLEKVRGRVLAARDAMPGPRKALFDWAMAVAVTVSRRVQMGLPIGRVLQAEHDLCSKLVLEKIRARMGGRLKLIACGSAPLDPNVAEFFHALGLNLLEAYGLTETAALATINRPHDFRFGTVGKPIEGVQVKLANDGEILIKGPGNFSGYHGDTASTAAALKGGWLHTGDVGEFTADGFLRITDRKKDLIITSGGKKVAPQPLETMLKTEPLIGQVLIYGDAKPYLTALIALDHEECRRRVIANGWPTDPSRWVELPDVVQAVDQAVNRANGSVARFESIKKYVITPDELTIEGGHLTPTLKIRRKEVVKQYGAALERLYQ